MDNSKLINSSYIIHPDNISKLIFDIIGFILIIIQYITVPFSVAFDFEDKILTYYNYFSDIFFLFDLFLNFNCGFYNQGNLIMNRKQIVKCYLKGWFFFDFISSFPYSFIFDTIEFDLSAVKYAPRLLKVFRIARFIKILRLLKMVKFRSLFFKLEELLISDKIQGLFIYFKNMILFFFIWHLLACLWFTISYNEYTNNNDSIVNKNYLYDETISNQYLYMLYYVFTFSFTVGYGDFAPVSTNERFISMIFTMFTYSMFCYMLSTIRNIMQKSTYIEQDLKDKIIILKKFFKKKKLPLELNKKVTNYLEYFYNEKETKKIDSSEIFDLLNPKLSEELRNELNIKILNNFRLFTLPEYEIIVKNLCDSTYEEIINPNEIMITEGETTCSRMYFIEKGNVILYHEASSLVLKELGANNYFGEIGFFTRLPRSCSAISKTFCNIYFIIKNEFMSLLSELNTQGIENKLIYNMLAKDNYITYDNLFVKCYFCDDSQHVIINCPLFCSNDNLIFISKEKRILYKDIIKFSHNLNEFTRNLNNHNSTFKRNSASRSSLTRSSFSKKGRKSALNIGNINKI